MTKLELKLDVVIRRGGRSRTVPPESLAAALRLPSATIRTALARLLFASFDRDVMSDPAATREPTEGVEHERFGPFVPNVPKLNNSPIRNRNVGECGGSGERGGAALDAHALATALDDHASLSALAVLVARYPPDLLRSALTITLARPASEIRTTRGAYFTGVLRALAARAGTPPTSHVRSISPAP